jgi:hypothetical protein
MRRTELSNLGSVLVPECCILVPIMPATEDEYRHLHLKDNIGNSLFGRTRVQILNEHLTAKCYSLHNSDPFLSFKIDPCYQLYIGTECG